MLCEYDPWLAKPDQIITESCVGPSDNLFY